MYSVSLFGRDSYGEIYDPRVLTGPKAPFFLFFAENFDLIAPKQFRKVGVFFINKNVRYEKEDQAIPKAKVIWHLFYVPSKVKQFPNLHYARNYLRNDPQSKYSKDHTRLSPIISQNGCSTVLLNNNIFAMIAIET